MPPPEPAPLIQAIEQLIDFLTAFGDSEHSRIARFREFVERVQRETPTKQLLAT